MAFPTNFSLTLRETFVTIVQIAREVRSLADSLNTDSAAGPVSVTRVVQVADTLAAAHARFEQLKDANGLQDYVRAEYGDDALDLTASFAAMQAAIVDVVTWVIANVPKDGAGSIGERYFDANGRVAVRTVTTAQLAQLRTRLVALVATLAP